MSYFDSVVLLDEAGSAKQNILFFKSLMRYDKYWIYIGAFSIIIAKGDTNLRLSYVSSIVAKGEY